MNQWGNDQYPMMMTHMMGPGPPMGPGPHMVPGPQMGMGPGPQMGMGPGPQMGMGPGPQMGMGPGPQMGMGPVGPPALLPTPMHPPNPVPGGVPALIPPSFLLNEWGQGHPPNLPSSLTSEELIGPQKPEIEIALETDNENSDNKAAENNGNKPSDHGKSTRDRDQKDGRRDGDRDRDRGRRGRSPYNRRDNRDRNDRSRGDRRERRPGRWGENKDDGSMGNNIMPGNMMPYGNNMMMGQQSMDMQNVPNMMPNMHNMMPGMNMMSNMMPGMMPNTGMDQNVMMMMNINAPPQPICMSNGVLLPPLPNCPTPSRRVRPPGCRTIFVGGLPTALGEDGIKEIFERFGVVTDVKIHKQGVCHVRFGSQELVDQSFFFSGYRFKRHDQVDSEATSLFIDYALNRDDQTEFERNKRRRTPTPPRIEPYTPSNFSIITEKIKSDTEFSEAAPTLAIWLERGECNKKNANAFYSLIQASNNQIRRLYSEKMAIDEEFQTIKNTMREKFAAVITQFEQVGKILMAAKMQRVSDHFSKQQRRNIEMWLKMTEDVDNIKEEFNVLFEDDEVEDNNSKGAVLFKKYDELKVEHENLQYELEGYKNEAHLAKDEAERKFEKFKAHFIAQQALQGPIHHHQVQPPLPSKPAPPLPKDPPLPGMKSQPPPPPSLSPSDAKLISILTAFLLVHPLGATLDYLVSYVRSIIPDATQAAVQNILMTYRDLFSRQNSGIGAKIESKWKYVTFDIIKKEVF